MTHKPTDVTEGLPGAIFQGIEAAPAGRVI